MNLRHFFIFGAALIGACGGGGDRPTESVRKAKASPEAKAAEEAKAVEAERITAREQCRTTMIAKLAELKRLMAKQEYWPATIEIRECAELLSDPKLKSMVAEAEQRSYIFDIESRKTSDHDRVRAMDALLRDYPAQGKKYMGQKQALEKRLAEKSRQSRADNDARYRFWNVPKIGSSQSEVISNGWGRPSDINRTITASGVKEQWVYGGGRYLYFESGILVAIQE